MYATEFLVMLCGRYSFSSSASGELEHLHSRVANVFEELVDRRSEHPEVLRDYRKLPEFFGNDPENVVIGPFDPLSALRCRVAERDRPVRLEASEMIYPHHVAHLRRERDPPQPPAVAVRLELVPPVKRVAPELSVVAERVRRAARDRNRFQIGVKVEVLGIRPHVCRVESHVNRNVADYFDALRIRVRLERVPLRVKKILDRRVVLDF